MNGSGDDGLSKSELPRLLCVDANVATPDENDGTPSEIEIKFRLEKATLEEVLTSPLLKATTLMAARKLTSVYFDTPGNDLCKNGMTLRVRKQGRSSAVLGLKLIAPGQDGPFSRGEIEIPFAKGGEPDLELFDPASRKRIKRHVGNNPLKAKFETRVLRRTASLRHGHSEIEVALDDGVIIAGEAQLPVTELELELKTGSLVELLGCASEFARMLQLRLDFASKAERGYRSSEGTTALPQKATPVEIATTANFDDLVAAVVSNTLSQFVANWAALRESDEPESVHQLRVALRRMRSGLGMFKKVITLPELDDLRNEAKRIASALGPARDSDAFLQNVRNGPLKDMAHPLKGAGELLDAVEALRVESYAIARRLIEDRETSLFVLKVQEFIARRAWRNALAPEDLSLLTSPGRAFASDALSGLHRRALKRGKNLPDVPDEKRHELRIALKNLRYAAEFFGNLFDARKEHRAFLRHVSELQDILGAHNDAATSETFLERLKTPPGADSHYASGFVLGWYRNATIAADARLMKRWKSFKDAKRFWK